MNKIFLDDIEIIPSKVVCIGRNYMDHINELNNEVPEDMVFFIKPNSAVSNRLVFPKNQNSCHYEAEISFLIEDDKISAVGFGLDLTLREVQSKLKAKGLPWERAKAFDGAAVFSKFISFDKDISKLEIELYINGELKQKGDYSLMINKPNEIINEAKTFLSFEDGDILMSGTPKGVGSFKVGDVFLGRILFDNKIILEEEFIVF
ncbi:MAG: fumarylacetoacetate hydrolase family protein [Arcobacter sp.]|jgi:2-keto-4-pentenoate hydratase/2-oxohepta-3-ene-1,7-dioic acid hydratase in catechol pathway|uniref:fumarylacetoacetate hydrolase family protein n=1 Tax=Arcobacter sp. TaxID=1872629 RepID=UPI002A766B4E|nr:fumarylacetoacetate hydrolase family protein [Arcobacter sp.]MDY3199975.1 fumarylacetoacetate hydrolase family protein [Arcobacter sp.]